MDLPQPPVPPEPPLISHADPPFRVHDPDGGQTTPAIFASPHSGRQYPADFLAAARLDALRLRRSEDSFIDELFDTAPGHGAPLLAATFPRAFCDANREPWELDPTMFADALPPWVNTASARVGAGLGTIPRVVASGEAIYTGKLRFVEAQARIALYWQPFHDALSALIDRTLRQFGACVLVDCHSMPANATPGRARVDFVIGDAHGTACAPALVRQIEQAILGLGYTCRRNDPYAGGYITRHYGHPRDGVHALQIEVCRSLYMDEARIERLARFADVRARMERLVAAIADSARGLA